MDPGTMADWANVVVTASALSAASWAGWSAYQSLDATREALKIERDREQKRADAEVASQAALIAAWPVGDAQVGSPPAQWKVILQNNIGVPVYDVSVLLSSPERRDAGQLQEIGLLAPGESSAPYPAAWCVETVQDEHTGVGGGQRMAVPCVDVSITFTDATGYVAT